MARDFKREITNKEQILGEVRNAIIEKQEALIKDVDQHTDTWIPIKEEDGTAITFVQNFKEQGGIFVYLEDEDEFAECLRQLAPENAWEPLWCTSPTMQKILEHNGIVYTTGSVREPKQKLVSITDCECLVAQTGSIVLSEKMCHSRKNYATPDVLLVTASTNQIVNGLKDAFIKLKGKYGDGTPSQIAIITGSSRTSDIEQTQVIGALGTRQVAVFLIDEE